MTATTTVLAVADADSYEVECGHPRRATRRLQAGPAVVASPITPSPEQAVAATGGPVGVVSIGRLRRLLRRASPDVLLLACTGPTVRALVGLPELRQHRRPVLVTGLPGISVPASARAVELRRGCDLFVTHSRRERSDFTALAAELARPPGRVEPVAVPLRRVGPDDARDRRGLRGPGQGATGST